MSDLAARPYSHQWRAGLVRVTYKFKANRDNELDKQPTYPTLLALSTHAMHTNNPYAQGGCQFNPDKVGSSNDTEKTLRPLGMTCSRPAPADVRPRLLSFSI